MLISMKIEERQDGLLFVYVIALAIVVIIRSIVIIYVITVVLWIKNSHYFSNNVACYSCSLPLLIMSTSKQLIY